MQAQGKYYQLLHTIRAAMRIKPEWAIKWTVTPV